MKREPCYAILFVSALALAPALLAGCTADSSLHADSGTPPAAVVEHEGSGNTVRVDHPERFATVPAAAHGAERQLSVTGVVTADVSRSVPVVSLAAGRVIDIRARLGDHVEKGQVLVRIQSADVAAAFADYRKALSSRDLADSQLERANTLLERGAIARKDVEVAMDTQAKARVDVENASERLRVFGVDPNGAPSPIVDLVAPISGVVTEQNVTNAAGVKSLDNSPNLFTISDLSNVWIIGDVHENDLASVRVGDTATIHVAAYPDAVLIGRIDNIAAVLDPSTRTAKVRVEVANAGILRIGMFVTATFRGVANETRAAVPAAAVLHLHDRDWVYLPMESGRFERRQVVSGPMLPGNMQELQSGVRPGEQVIANALVFQSTTEQ